MNQNRRQNKFFPPSENQRLIQQHIEAKNVYLEWKNGTGISSDQVDLLYDAGFKVSLPAGARESRVRSDTSKNQCATWKRYFYKQKYKDVERKSVNLKLNTDLLLSDTLFKELSFLVETTLPNTTDELNAELLGDFAEMFDFSSVENGKHLAEYLQDKNQKKPCYSYNIRFIETNTAISDAVDQLIQTEIQDKNSPMNGQTLQRDAVGLSYTPRKNCDNYINLEIKLYMPSPDGSQPKDSFHTGSHYKRGVVLNIHVYHQKTEASPADAIPLENINDFSKGIARRIGEFKRSFFESHYKALNFVDAFLFNPNRKFNLYSYDSIYGKNDVNYVSHGVKFNQPPPTAPQIAPINMNYEQEFPPLS